MNLQYMGRGVYKTIDPIQSGAVIVPAGFITDLASVPRIFWNIFPPFGRYERATIGHDYRYTLAIGTRKQADKQFLKEMKMLGVPFWKRRLIYRAVRIGGRGNYE